MSNSLEKSTFGKNFDKDISKLPKNLKTLTVHSKNKDKLCKSYDWIIDRDRYILTKKE